jgi:hydrogenase maturation protease
MKEDNKILVLGIGNVLLGDEGVGVHVVKELEKHEMPSHVTLLDGGTGGFHLLSWLQDYQEIIMIDATLDQKPEGSISIIKPKFSSDFPRTLSSHDIGLKDLIESASLLGELPEITLFTVSVDPEQSLTMELSDIISESVDKIAKEIMKILDAK